MSETVNGTTTAADSQVHTLVCRIWEDTPRPAWAALTSSQHRGILACTSTFWQTWDAAMRAARRQNASEVAHNRYRDARDAALAEFEAGYRAAAA